jgi:arylsulfatase
MFGNRGIYHDGWSAVTKHRTPWQTTGDAGVALDDDIWELYDGSSDWTQARDLAREHPDKLHQLQRQFLIEATRYKVLPLDDRGFERVDPDIAGRPKTVGAKQVLLPGMQGLLESHLVNWRNRSWQLTAQITVPDGGAEGVILNLGGAQGGWSLYLKDGAPAFAYNLLGITTTHVHGDAKVAPGVHQVRMEFAYDGGGIAKGGGITLFTDGVKVGEGRVEATQPAGFGYEYSNVGEDALSQVTDDYTTAGGRFTGTIDWVEMEGGEDSHDHLLDPEMVLNFAMAKQ